MLIISMARGRGEGVTGGGLRRSRAKLIAFTELGSSTSALTQVDIEATHVIFARSPSSSWNSASGSGMLTLLPSAGGARPFPLSTDIASEGSLEL